MISPINNKHSMIDVSMVNRNKPVQSEEAKESASEKINESKKSSGNKEETAVSSSVDVLA